MNVPVEGVGGIAHMKLHLWALCKLCLCSPARNSAYTFRPDPGTRHGT